MEDDFPDFSLGAFLVPAVKFQGCILDALQNRIMKLSMSSSPSKVPYFLKSLRIQSFSKRFKMAFQNYPKGGLLFQQAYPAIKTSHVIQNLL